MDFLRLGVDFCAQSTDGKINMCLICQNGRQFGPSVKLKQKNDNAVVGYFALILE